VAVAAGSLELAKYLCMMGVSLDSKDANENTPLHYAASLGRLELCEFLMNRACTTGLRNKKRMEALHASILSHDLKTFEFFLTKANPFMKPEIMKELLEQRVGRGLTSLMLAVEDGSIDIFHYILKYGPKLNVADERGKTCLHLALENGNDEMTETLLRNRANPNIKDIFGETPMFTAVRKLDKRAILVFDDFFF
jgi:ankyrin repeat protein